VFGRSGCFSVHDHPGVVSDFFLAVDNYQGEGVSRHDLGLYEVLWSIFAIALFMLLVQKPRKRGFFMALLPMIYAPVRFFLDFLRETPDHGGDVRYFGLTPGQYGSILFFIVGVVIAVRVARKPEAQLMLPGASLPKDYEAPAPEKSGGTRKQRSR